MNDRELRLRQRLRDDFPVYAEFALRIRNKGVRNKQAEIVPFALNQAQRYLHKALEDQRKRQGYIRAIILKGRQQGCSTYIQGRYYWRVTHTKGAQAYILTHEQNATDNLFRMAQRYHEYCPDMVKPVASNDSAKELVFGKLDSGYKVGTAGARATGRSSTIQYFHGSEVAFWPNAEEHAAGVMQAVSDSQGTELILESTANGMGNFYHEKWQEAEAGKGDYQAVFIPWYWQQEYAKSVPEGWAATEEEADYQDVYGITAEQLVWVRSKVSELGGWPRFHQEYPATPDLAFQFSDVEAFIKPELVMKARQGKVTEPYGALVAGVDPARFGEDRTAIIRRRGRRVYGEEYHDNVDLMQTTGYVVRLIEEEKVKRVFIDVGGLGAGIVDRLRELGYGASITAVNSGESPMDKERYKNKRAEMWAKMREWLEDQPCEIPDSNALHADLCGPSFSYDSNTRLQLEKKEDMKKRGIRSPDGGDALALTFAAPVNAKPKPRPKQDFSYIV